MYSIQKKITYPEVGKTKWITRKVIIAAFIDEDGNVTHAKIIKGMGGGIDEDGIMMQLKELSLIPENKMVNL